MLTLLLATTFVSTPLEAPETDLKLREIFDRKSWFGKTATGLAWSPDDRYLAYLWNPYKDRGFDLWLYDSKTGDTKRVTGIELMSNFDRDTKKAIERYQKDDAEEKKREGLSEEQKRSLDVDDRRENEKRTEPLPSYGGVGDFSWAKGRNEMLFTFKGDLYRWKVGEELPTRMTKTQESESQPQYTPNDDGFTFRRSTGVFRVRFDNAMVEQLNPTLPSGHSVGGYTISPDGTKMLITSFKIAAPMKQIEYMTYRGRFATVARASRVTADEKNPYESRFFIYDLNDDPKTNPAHDGKAWEIWKSPAIEDYMTESVDSEPWSPDSSRLTFSVVSFLKGTCAIYVADVNKREVKAAYKTTFEGDLTTPDQISPFFSPDGSKIVAMLNNTGFEHAWMIDPATESGTPLTRGNFAAFPLKMTKDGKHLYVRASKEHIARTDIYKVDVANGDMQRLTKQTGSYGFPQLNHKQDSMGLTFANWSNPNEMYVMSASGNSEKKLTDSHREGFERVNKLKPELFTYKNRHGQDIQGMLFLPPGYKKTDKRPLFIGVYGGPSEGQRAVVDGRFFGAYYWFNMYAAYTLGYVAIAVDPRGMSSNGTAFAKANMDNPGQAQLEDLIDVVDYMKTGYNVDAEKVGVSGWSFGGFQTLTCMLKAPEVFKLGIAGAPVTEWVNYNYGYNAGVIAKVMTDDPKSEEKFSLLPYAKNLKGPLMLLHGMEDDNVLFQDTVKLYRRLLQYGKGPLVELALDPTGTHGLGGDINTYDRMAINVAFLMKHWGPYTG